MRHLRRLRHRLRSLLRPGAVERELERELALHLELLEREAAAGGLDSQAARLEAHRSFGSAALTADRCRDTRRLGLLRDLARDVAYAWRLLVRAPAFTITALLSLAVGFGGTTAMFAVMEAALWRTLPRGPAARSRLRQGRGLGRSWRRPTVSVLRTYPPRRRGLRRPRRLRQRRAARGGGRTDRTGVRTGGLGRLLRGPGRPPAPGETVHGRRRAARSGGGGHQPRLLAATLRRRTGHRRPWCPLPRARVHHRRRHPTVVHRPAAWPARGSHSANHDRPRAHAATPGPGGSRRWDG